MTDARAEAVEAAVRAIDSRASCEHERAWIDVPALRYENCFDCDGRAAVAAAVGPLLAPVRALHRREQERFYPWRTTCTEDGEDWPCCTTKALDAIESEVTSEGGRDE